MAGRDGPGRRLDVEPDPLPLGERGEERDGPLDDGDRVDVLGLDRGPLGVEPGEVEDVVQRVEQALAAGVDGLGVLAEVVGDLGPEDVGEPEHGRQRRPDLVAHVGQDRRLELGRLLGLLTGLLGRLDRLEQPVLVGPPLLDVAGDRHERRTVAEPARRDLERDRLAPGLEQLEHDRHRPVPVGVGEVEPGLLLVDGEVGQPDGPAVGAGPVGLDPERALGGPVGLDDLAAPLDVEDDDGVGGRLE